MYSSSLLGIYLSLFIIISMVVYAGVDNTLRVFTYLELQIKFLPIRIRIFFFKRKLKRMLAKDIEDQSKLIKEIKNGR